MHLGRFDLNLLVALDALLHEKNVTRAAERVFVTQPAMSLILGKLRDYFNDPLLVRVGREHELTARGLALVEPVREMLLRAQALLGTQPVFDPGSVERTFKLMMPDYVAMSLMPPTLKRLVVQAPAIELQLSNWTSSGPAHLVNGEIDMMVTFARPEVLGHDKFPESLCRTHLQLQRWVCAVATDHPEVQGELTREQFLGLPHVSLRIPGHIDGLSLIRKRENILLNVRVTTEQLMQIPFLLPGTPLIAIIPEQLGRKLAGCLDIRVAEIPDSIVPVGRIELFWHRRNEPDPGHTWLRNLLLDAAQT